MRERDLREKTTTTTNSTVNYDLPQWNGEDITSWMTNLNDAFNKIDSAMWANHTAMAGYDKIASDLQKLADGLKVDNAEIREALRLVQQGMAQQLAELNQAKQAITNANIAITQLQQEDNALSAMVEDLQDDIGMLPNYIIIKNEDENPLLTMTSFTDNTVTLDLERLFFAHTRTCGCVFRVHNLENKTGNFGFHGEMSDELRSKVMAAVGKETIAFISNLGRNYYTQLSVNTSGNAPIDCNIQLLDVRTDGIGQSSMYGVFFDL